MLALSILFARTQYLSPGSGRVGTRRVQVESRVGTAVYGCPEWLGAAYGPSRVSPWVLGHAARSVGAYGCLACRGLTWSTGSSGAGSFPARLTMLRGPNYGGFARPPCRIEFQFRELASEEATWVWR